MAFAPRSELDARLAGLRRHLEEHALDGALLHGVTNLLYFAGTAQQAHLWVPVADEPVLLVRRVLERARADSALDRIEPMTSLRELSAHLGGARRVGFELDIMPVSLHARYRKVLPDAEASDVGPLTRLVRSVKSPWEVDRIRAAARAADATLRDLAAELRPGMRELDLAIVAEGAERRHGSQGMLRWHARTGFECPWVHVLAGSSTLSFSFSDTPFGGDGVSPAAPYGAGHRVIEPHMPVCVDFAIPVDGYIHDMTRTLVVGGLPEPLAAAHRVCRDIHTAFLAEARPGRTGDELWQVAVAVADGAGLGDHFMGWGEHRVRFVGHGLGLELDEPPVIAPRQSQPFEEGTVLALEPKMFFPGVGAVGLENTYVIRSDHVEKLTVTGDEVVVV